jgi:hypothetical protein
MISLPLLLAIACTLEVDLAVRSEVVEQRECALIWSVHGETALATGRPLAQVVRGYVSGWKCEGKKCDTARFKTIRSMNARGEAPLNWDIRVGPWSKFQDLWLRRLRAAQEFVAVWMRGRVLWPQSSRSCRMSRHYGGRCAMHGACDHVPECWQLASCGQTASAFWIPRTCSAGAGVIDAVTASARR